MYVRYNLKAYIICKINLKYAKNTTQHINIHRMHKINIKKNILKKTTYTYVVQ